MKKEEKRCAVCCPRCKARVVGELDRGSLILKDFMVGYQAAE